MNNKLIHKVFALADKSFVENEFPVGAIIYDENGIISCGYNRRHKTKKTTDHAEIIAIGKANKKLNEWRLEGKNMLVTLEPCDMCKTVIKEARLNKVYYIIPRYEYKKQYKCTQFELYDFDSKIKDQYYERVTNFFTDKH